MFLATTLIGLPLVCISTILVKNKPDSDASVLGVDYANLDKKDSVPEYRCLLWEETMTQPVPYSYPRNFDKNLAIELASLIDAAYQQLARNEDRLLGSLVFPLSSESKPKPAFQQNIRL